MIQTFEINFKEDLLKENEQLQKKIEVVKSRNEAKIKENLEKIKNLQEDTLYSKSVLIDELNETEFIEILPIIDFVKITKEDLDKIFEKIDSFERKNLKKSLLTMIDCVVYGGDDTFMDFCYKMKKYNEILLEIRTENS